MSDTERAQRLRVLLAKVQTNAALSVPGRPAPKKLAAWPTDDEYTSFPDERPSAAPDAGADDVEDFAASALGRRYQSEDRWTSLLSGALEPAEAGEVERAPAAMRAVPPPADDGPEAETRGEEARDDRAARLVRPTPEPEMPATSFASVAPLPPPPVIEEPSIPRAADSERGMPPKELAHPSDPPASALVRAIAKAAKERAVELGRSDEIWGDVLDNLRERRPTSRPEINVSLAAMSPSAPEPAPAAMEPLATSEATAPSRGESGARARAVDDTSAEGEPDREIVLSRRARRRLRLGARRSGERPSSTGRWLGWGLVAASVAAVAVASVTFVPRWLSGSPSDPRGDARAGEASGKAEPVAPAPPSATTSAAAEAHLAAPASQDDPRSTPMTDASAPPRDAPNLPANYGYVYFLSERPLHVYVNGLLAGETGEWLKVECDYRNVRFSERSVPKLGGPFPVWAGDGHTIIVPCRAATRFDSVAH